MSEELIDSYVDRSAIEGDTRFLEDQLKTVLSLFDKVNSTKITLQSAKGLQEVSVAAKEANTAADELAKSKKKLIEVDLEAVKRLKELVTGNRQLSESYADLIKQSVQNEVAAKALREERSKLNKAFKEGQLPLDQYELGLKEIKEAELALKGSNQELGRALKNMEKDAASAEGSLNKMRAQLNLALQAFDNLSAEDKQSDIGQNLQNSINELTAAITKEEQATQRFQRNVGNYQGSAKIIVDSLEKAKKGFSELSKSADASPAALQRAARELEALTRITDNPQFLKVAAKTGDAQNEVRFFTRQLVAMEQAELGSTEAAEELRKRLAKLTDEIGDTRAEIKALSSDSRSFDLFAGSVAFAVDTFQTFAGAAQLAGASEEDVAEATKNLIAIQAVANGVKGIATELTTKGTAANKAFAFVQNQVSIAMDTTATATARLKAALITTGIGAFVVLIGYLVANFDKLKVILTDSAKRQKEYADAMAEAKSEISGAISQVSKLKDQVELAKQGFLDKDKVVKEYNDTIGKTTGSVKTLDEVEKILTKNGEAYIQFTIKKAVAQKLFDKAAQETVDALVKSQEALANEASLLEKSSKMTGQAAESRKQIAKSIQEGRDKDLADSKKHSDGLVDIAKTFEKEAAEIAKKFNFNFFGDTETTTASTKKFFEDQLKVESEALKLISQAEELYLNDRTRARIKAAEIDRKIIEGARAVDIENAKGDAAKIAEINQKASFDLKQIKVKLNEDLLKIQGSFIQRSRDMEKEANDQFIADQKERESQQISILQDRHEDRLKELAEGQQSEIEALDKQHQKILATTRAGSKAREKAEQEIADQRAEIEFRYAKAVLETEIELAQKLIALRKSFGLDTSAAEKALAEQQIAFSDLVTKHKIENDKKQSKSEKEKYEGIVKGIETAKTISNEVGNIIGGLISANVDREKNQIQDQIDNIEKKKQKEIEAINASSLSEEEKNQKIQILEARTQAQREQLELRQRQLDINKAKFEKARIISEIIMNTALAVVKVLATGNVPLAFAVGALGAAQLAVAIAQPIPRFRKGRDKGPATLAIVGDGGVSEVVASPDLKQAYKTPAKDTLTYLPEDWRVFPDVDSFTKKASRRAFGHLPYLIEHKSSAHDEKLGRMMAAGFARMASAFINRPEHNTYMNNGEFRNGVKKGNDHWEYLQDNI